MTALILNLTTLVRGLGDVLFPPVCVHCRGLVEDSGYRHLCARCARRLDFDGSRFRPAPEPSARLDLAFDHGCAAVLFRGPARALVIELKYHQGLHVLEDMTEIFRRAPAVLACAHEAVLVPVPLHPRKRRERGYNQSALLARALARAAGGPRIAHLLQRTVDTPTQTRFDRRTRRTNLKNAFALVRRPGLNPGQRYLLVDDVFTTGSTLNSCAQTLRRAGCLNLDALTFGHG